MNDHTEGLKPITDRASFLARTRKAIAGGIAGAVGSGAGTAIGAAFADGAISGAEAWGIVGLALGGFLVGFGTVYAAPANA